MTKGRRGLFCRLAVISFLLLPASVSAQFFPGRVTGTVRDASGAVVPGAEVKLSSPAIGFERAATTNSSGVFNFAQLPLAVFKLTVGKQGFETYVQTGIATSLEKVNEIEVVLATGAVSTQVRVSGAAPLIQTQTNVIGGEFSSKEVEQLPLGNSDYTRYPFFLPGTSTNTAYTFTQLAINGSPSRSVTFNIDGSQNMDAYRQLPAVGQGGNSYTAASRVPPDAIEELSVVTNGAAEAGPGAGSVNVVLKGGTNTLHGTLYEMHRDRSLEAHNFFENLAGSPKGHFIWNEYGASLGGPIVRNKLFFFVSYDGGRSGLGSAQLANAPSSAQISAAENALANDGQPLNQLGLTILKLYQPHEGRFLVSGVGRQNPDNGMVKIDYRVGQKDLLTGRYLIGNGLDSFPQGSDSPRGGSQLSQFFGDTPARAQNVAVSEVHSFSPNLVNTARISYIRNRQGFFSADSGFNPASIGLNTGAAPEDFGLPEIDVGRSVFENLGINPSFPRQRITEGFQFSNDAVLTRGSHSIQFGASWGLSKVYGFNDTNFRGILTFDGSQLGDSLTTDQPVADLIDLLAGRPNPASSSINRGSSRFDLHQNAFGLYAMDTFRLTNRLTVIGGLRWDFFGVPLEDRDRFSNFFPSQGLVHVHRTYEDRWKNFSPRLALAYSLFKRTVIRAGYAIYYINSPLDVLVGQTFNLTNNNPGLATNPANGQGIFAAPLISSPIQPNVPIFAASGTPTPPFNLIAVDPSLKTPSLQSWNLNVEQEIARGVVFQVGYVGAKGTHILNELDVNQPPAGAGFGPGCGPSLPNPACEQAARPFVARFPQFGQIATITSGGNSSYHALQAQLRTRNYRGLTASFSYTWAHAIDEASETLDFFGSSGFIPRDSTNLKSNRSSSEFDVPQAVSFTYVYELPKTNYTGVAGQILNNWQVSGVVTYHNSMPLPVLTFDDISGTGELHDVPNCTGPIVTQFKNFSVPAVVSGLSEPAPGTFGNCPRNSLPGPTLAEWDSSLGKYFPIGERFTLEFRVDAFNFLNHTNFGDPFLVLNDEFVSGTADNVNNDSHFGNGAQRQFQLNLKLVW